MVVASDESGFVWTWTEGSEEPSVRRTGTSLDERLPVIADLHGCLGQLGPRSGHVHDRLVPLFGGSGGQEPGPRPGKVGLCGDQKLFVSEIVDVGHLDLAQRGAAARHLDRRVRSESVEVRLELGLDGKARTGDRQGHGAGR